MKITRRTTGTTGPSIQELNGKLAMKAARIAGYRYRTMPSMKFSGFDQSTEFDIDAELVRHLQCKKRRTLRRKLRKVDYKRIRCDSSRAGARARRE